MKGRATAWTSQALDESVTLLSYLGPERTSVTESSTSLLSVPYGFSLTPWREAKTNCFCSLHLQPPPIVPDILYKWVNSRINGWVRRSLTFKHFPISLGRLKSSHLPVVLKPRQAACWAICDALQRMTSYPLENRTRPKSMLWGGSFRLIGSDFRVFWSSKLPENDQIAL